MTLSVVARSGGLVAAARRSLATVAASGGRLAQARQTSRLASLAGGARVFSQAFAPDARAFVLGINSAGAGIAGHAVCAPVGGILALPDARTILVDLTGSVTSVALPTFTGDRRIVVYLRQGSTGGRSIAGWPSAIQWPDAQAPDLSLAAHSIDCLVLDVMDGGASIFGNLVGAGYGPA